MHGTGNKIECIHSTLRHYILSLKNIPYSIQFLSNFDGQLRVVECLFSNSAVNAFTTLEIDSTFPYVTIFNDTNGI